jgi:hypothetical protein
MYMIGHQDVGMHCTAPIDSRFFKPVEVTVIILLGDEAWLSIDASLYKMLRCASELDAWTAGHALSVKIKRS